MSRLVGLGAADAGAVLRVGARVERVAILVLTHLRDQSRADVLVLGMAVGEPVVRSVAVEVVPYAHRVRIVRVGTGQSGRLLVLLDPLRFPERVLKRRG